MGRACRTGNTRLRESGLSQAAFEDQIGWAVDDPFVSEERTLSEYSVEFFTSLCEGLAYLG
jgi:hypothetical protein